MNDFLCRSDFSCTPTTYFTNYVVIWQYGVYTVGSFDVGIENTAADDASCSKQCILRFCFLLFTFIVIFRAAGRLNILIAINLAIKNFNFS